MASAISKERELDRPAEVRKRRFPKIALNDLAVIDQEIEKAPPRYRKSIPSLLKEDVFKRIDPQFPLLLRKASEHRMEFGQFLAEIELLLGMGDVHDPESSVYIYSVQVTDPVDIAENLDIKTLEAFAPKEALIELRNGYIRHELLYDIPDFQSKILLISLLRCARKVQISIKPPWSPYRVNSLVVLPS